MAANQLIGSLRYSALYLCDLPEFADLCDLVRESKHYVLANGDVPVWSGTDLEIFSLSEMLSTSFDTAQCFSQASEKWRALASNAQELKVHTSQPLPFSAPFTLGGFCFNHDEGGFISVPARCLIVSGEHLWFYCAGNDDDEFLNRLAELHEHSARHDFLENNARSLALAALVEEAKTWLSERLSAEGCGLTGTISSNSQQAHCDVETSINVSEQQWANSVSAASAMIQAGELDKVVLARSLQLYVNPVPSLGMILAELKKSYPDCWIYSMGSLIGASPEMLASLRDGKFLSRVLAGSVPPGQESELWDDPKQLHEHAVALQSALDSLHEHGIHVHTQGPYELKLTNISHLATDISANGQAMREQLATTHSDCALADGLFDPTAILRLAEVIHPTAAVCGLPRAKANEVIRQLENENRGYYAGVLGWVDSIGEGQMALALRCAQVEENTPGCFKLWAGAGIMGNSVPEKEVAETNTKFSAVFKAIKAASAKSL